jgi:hypothetical protein
MKLMVLLSISVLGLALTAVAMPAVAAVPITVYTDAEGTNYLLSPGEADGSCTPIPGGGGMTCSGPSGYSSGATDSVGCLSRSGLAFCVIIPDDWSMPPGGNLPLATNTLECSTQNYELTVTGETSGCTENNGIEMSCSQPGTPKTASASCKKGCGKVVGEKSKCIPKSKPGE